MAKRVPPLALIWPVGLLVLVGVLAALQYRWLGEVSVAERDRLRASLADRAREFAEDFDRELLRLYIGLQSEGTALQMGDWSGFATRYETWRQAAKAPGIVRAVYLTGTDRAPAGVLKYDEASRAFVDAAWPDALVPLRAAAVDVTPKPSAPEMDHLTSMARDPLAPQIPAMSIGLPALRSVTSDEMRGVFSMRISPIRLIVWLDRDYIRSTFLPTLADRYFPPGGIDDYRVEVTDANASNTPVFARGTSEGARLDEQHADASVSLFSLRPDLADQVANREAQALVFGAAAGSALAAPSRVAGGPRMSTSGAYSIVVQRRGAVTADTHTTFRVGGQPGWTLALQHATGSLDIAVNQTRRRNLWLSFGILAVLGAGVVLVVVNARRAERLAGQQMDFVATVSHELRTPLAVIRSAAQNLSAGVIQDPDQARRYGELIDTEGRRLTDMVEQVLEFAGLSGNRRPQVTRPLDAGVLVRDVIDSCRSLADEAHVEMSARIDDDVPPVLGDESALRRAVHNLVANAVKYGASGGWIGLAVRKAPGRGAGEVLIDVSDRGLGIDAADLPHIFEPFYRGRQALDRQIHGNGLGLSLVQRIAEAHGGRVTVKSAPREGSTFTIHLPAAEADRTADELTPGVVSPEAR